MAHNDRRSGKDSAEPPRTWGALARKGAFRLSEDVRDAGTAMPEERIPEVWVADEWHDEGPIVDSAKLNKRLSKRSKRRDEPSVEVDVDVAVADLVKLLGEVRGSRAEARLREAAVAYANERYGEARSTLAPLVVDAPSSVALRELFGLTLYRLGLWKEALKELEFVVQAGEDLIQAPVIMDCFRALRRWHEVDDWWARLQSPHVSADTLGEGLIVYAGSLADRGDLASATDLLRTDFKLSRKPREIDLRQAYVLADLYERGGDVPSARTWFRRIADHDVDYADVFERLKQL